MEHPPSSAGGAGESPAAPEGRGGAGDPLAATLVVGVRSGGRLTGLWWEPQMRGTRCPRSSRRCSMPAKNTECYIADTTKGCDMDTLFNQEAASPQGKYCARPINRMGDSPRAVSNQRKGSRFPARPLNQPRWFVPGTSSFRGGRFAHCAKWTPLVFPTRTSLTALYAASRDEQEVIFKTPLHMAQWSASSVSVVGASR